MTKVYILHGWDGYPDEPLFRWLEKNLKENRFEVIIPAMPHPENPTIGDWVKMASELESDEETIFVGHSIGCQTILRTLEKYEGGKKIQGIVLIAPWMRLDEETIKEEGQEIIEIAKPWMETPIDFEKVRSHTGKVVAIFSDDDPYVRRDQADFFKNKLGAEIIFEEKKGHFSPSDKVVEVPSILNAILNITK